MTNNSHGIEEVPNGVPGRIRMCEWCGRYTNNLVMDGDMVFCPACNKPSLIKACAECEAPIPFPPQLYCLSCGKRLTILPMVEQDGRLVQATITEPDPERRKLLESKGGDWYDVLRGKAEGPEPPETKAKSPQGWDQKAFNALLQQAVGQAGEQPDVRTPEQPQVPVNVRVCLDCGVKLTFHGVFETYKCPVCEQPAEEVADPPPPG